MKSWKLYIALCILFAMCTVNLNAQEEKPILPADSVSAEVDSLQTKAKIDTISSDSVKKKSIDAPIFYTANDSVVVFGDGTAIMYGASTVKYDNMELEASFIRCKMDSSLMYAAGTYDSVKGEYVGKPIFKDQGSTYETNEITYNFRTKKGFIRNVVTQQGEGYVVADKTKKTEDDIMMMRGGHYTTCDQHDCPHFHLQLSKAKVKSNKYVVTGPAYLVVGGVPLPLAIPFGYFPFTDSYSSGLIMPTYGDDQTRGLYLNGLGYYFAFNDYFDTEITSDLYTRGTWAVRLRSKYLKRYKYTGNVNINYREDVTGDKDMPDYTKATNFNIQWTHTQDAKANPYSTFSASVNFSTSGYNRSNINSYYNAALSSENTKSSSVSYTQRFPESAWSLNMTANLSQRTKDSTLAMTLPSFNATLSRVYPFKRKKSVGKERWYEKIYMSYTGSFQNSITCKEDYFLKSSFVNDWRNGIKHNVPIGASFTLFKYLNVSPSVTLTDRMYFQRIDQSWDDVSQKAVADTLKGFYNVFDFNASLSFSTKIYGFFIPSRKLFGDKIDRFRHVFTPTVSMSYHPDFGSQFWNYFGTYDKTTTNKEGQTTVESITYSRFANGIYGSASQGKQGALNFSLANNLEMKILNRKDTVGKNPYKVVSLIDNLSITGGYNFIADSMNWSNFNVNLRLKLPMNYTINVSGAFDPYMYTTTASGQHVRCNELYWNHGRFPHFLGTSTSFGYTFSNQTFKKLFGERDNKENNDQHGDHDDNHNHDHSSQNTNEDFNKTDIAWSLNFNYAIRYGSSTTWDERKNYYKMELTHNLSLSGSVKLGENWNVSASTSFDFKAKQLTTTTFNITRNLHCWNMSASFVPFGPYTSYNFHIGVNASILQDLKYDKNSTTSTNYTVNWW